MTSRIGVKIAKTLLDFFFHGLSAFSSPMTLYVRSEANDHVLWYQKSMKNFILSCCFRYNRPFNANGYPERSKDGSVC